MSQVNKKVPTSLDIEVTFKLLKQVNGTSHVLISELATELCIKKTALMEIIVNDPEHYTWQQGLKTGRAILTYIK